MKNISKPTKIGLLTLPFMALNSIAAELPLAVSDDTFLAKTVAKRDNLAPSIERVEEQKLTAAKLENAKNKYGSKPNIVLILLDDVAYGDFGVYGGGNTVGAATPNIDAIANQGLQLNNAYSQPSCTPTRATIMTGQLPIRTGLLRPMLPGEGTTGIGLDKTSTLPQKLSNAGYTTQMVGKWHLGTFKEAQPQNVGFDHYYGILTSSDDYTAWNEQWRNPDLIHDKARNEWAKEGEIMSIVEGSRGEEARKVSPIDMESIRFVDEKLTSKATDFIASQEDTDKPFFLYYATRGAHNDNYPHPDFIGKSKSKYPYKDVIVELDHRIGEIKSSLKEAGKLDNTLFIITSDNGPFVEAFPDSGVTPFRGAKGTSYEGGVRVPTIAYWPGMIKPGQVSDGLFDLTDIYATALSVAGASDLLPTDRYIDSIDQSAFLLTENGKSHRREIFYWASNALMGVRIAEYKFMVKDQSFEFTDTWPKSSPFQSTVTDSLYGGKLFNLHIDPQERYAMTPLKQPHAPVLMQAINKHLKTFVDYPPAIKIK
ncbi:arylsulfatase [Psychromonas ossibalaenae]|uniref:arylsulfatase n=1 Tax=Psychromonas ossibalaenae TaxID=444922 RepID=UPI0003723E3C|nr:arylsulfatase [Psychromonas ossibalaenae]